MIQHQERYHVPKWVIVAALAGFLFSLPALGQSEIAAGKAPDAPNGGKPDKPKRFAELKDAIEDMQPMSGLFELYRYDPDDKDRDPEKLLCKIPKNLLQEDLLFATSISSGGELTSYMWQSYLVRWEIVGKHLKMVTPETRYVTKKDKPVTEVVERTYGDSFLASVPIVAMSPNGDPVIDLGQLLKSNIADVSFMGGGVRPELCKWNKIKNFPDNILIDVSLALGNPNGGGRMVGVSYSFRRLPPLNSYKPRAADDRIGYFLTAQMDWTKKHEAREMFDRYINRWQLEKRDPSLELSPPKKPITFYIEKTVPVQWRRWVREGILEWNKAFEKIGFVDAIVVQQQTEDNEFADLDPEDARYNFFRWIVTGDSFAMGPSRADPRTGQILDADIIMDDSFVRVFMQKFDLLGPSGAEKLMGPGFALWREQFPELAERAFPIDESDPPADLPKDDLIEIAQQKMHENGQHLCTYACGLRHQMAFLHNALIATGSGKKLPEKFIGEAIRETVTHEVGHTLGLRHNFKASNWLSMEEIKRRRDLTDEPTVASVMDYNPLLFFDGDTPENVRHFVTPTVGPWDYWVIEYGYSEAKNGKSEEDMLKEIASRCTQPELAYATDEDTVGTYSPDPTSNRFDMSSNPIDWAKMRIEMCDKMLPTIKDWSIQSGEARYFLRQAFNTLWYEKSNNLGFVARVVGGQYFNRAHKGDADARPAFEIVDPATQRAALKYLAETTFCDAFYAIDVDLMNDLAPSRWSHFGSRPGIRLDYPIHDRILTMQMLTLSDLLNPSVIQRIYDAELKSTAPDKFTAAEFIKTLNDTIWTELKNPPQKKYADAEPYISSIRRNLQRTYLDIMLAYARYPAGANMSADLTSMVRQSLRGLIENINGVTGGENLDFATRAHLIDCRSRIERALEAQFSDR